MPARNGARMSLAELEPWLDQIGEDVDVGIARKMARTAVAIQHRLFERTPVRTGHARSNWVVTLGSPSAVLIRAPGEFGESISLAAQVRTSLVAPATRSIYIVNNVPYITLLNQGSSRQAPAGFVEEAIAHGVTATRGMRIIGVV